MMGSNDVPKHTLVSAHDIVIRVIVIVLALTVSSVAMTSYETRTIEPQAQWEVLVDSFEMEVDYWEDIAFFNATEGWVVGKGDVGTEYEDRDHGIVMHTNNGGVDWELMYSEQHLSIYHIEIVDVDTIWLATRRGLLHTEDRGAFWKYSSGTGSTGFAAVKFRDNFFGLASIDKGLSYTIDEGETWYELETWNFNASLFEISFVGDDIIWACGISGIYRSSDGGSSWNQQRTQTANAMSVLSESEAWALSSGLGITHSTDGETWSEDIVVSEFSYQTGFYYDMEFIDENNGWLAGTGKPSVAYTPDGGKTWYAQMASSPRSIMTVDFVNETHGWVAGWNGFIGKTINGNQFGSKLIIDGYEFPVIMGTLRVPRSVAIIDTALIVILPVLFLFERVLFIIRRGRNQ